MPNTESFLNQWRATMSSAPNVTPEMLDELESHLRERIEQIIQSGVPEKEACERAATELGSSPAIAAEFRKLEAPSWLPVKIAVGIGIAIALAVAFRPFARPGGGVLLGVHVFTITVGYTTALLLGALGFCFALQRAWSGFSPLRLSSLSRVTFTFATVSTICTAIGIILGMIWSQREWGRLWGWDAKETGAFCIVLWMTGFLCAHRFRWVTTRGLLVASIFGSNIVLLGWFASNLPTVLHAYGFPHPAWLLLTAALVANVITMLIGLAPAGCLRARRA